MLVLSRKKNETILIGENIEILVVEVRGDRVRLGITAPPNVPIYRSEVAEVYLKGSENAAICQTTEPGGGD